MQIHSLPESGACGTVTWSKHYVIIMALYGGKLKEKSIKTPGRNLSLQV